MPMSFYKKLTVKIELKDDNDVLKSIGSGLIIAYRSSFFVLTAYHCLNPKNEDDIIVPRPEGWKIRLYTEKGGNIEIKDLNENKDDDIALIAIDCPDHDITDNKVQLFTDIVSKEQYIFRGFPAFLGNQPHTFKVSYIDDDYWSFDDKGIDSGRKTGVDLLEGTSGAGVFFCRRDKYFVVGIVRALHDRNGSLNEVKVIPIEKYKRYLPYDAFSKFSADLLDDWQRSLNDDNTAKQIEELKQKQIGWIENIIRKLKVLYPEQYKELLDLFLGYYVSGREFFVKEGNVNPSFWETLKNKTDYFFKTHQQTREIIVDTAGEAKKNYEDLEEKLVRALEELIPEDSGDKQVTTSFARYKLTERLLVCTLDYINRNKQDGTTKL